VFGIAVATTVFNAHGSLASAAAVTSGYRPALAVAAALSVAGALTALALRRFRPQPQPQPQWDETRVSPRSSTVNSGFHSAGSVD
jgi:hypothetical protein